MKYVYPAPIPLQTAAANRLRRMLVDWETDEVRLVVEILDAAESVVGTREFPATTQQLDGAIGLPGATLEEKLLRALPNAVGGIPPGGTIEP